MLDLLPIIIPLLLVDMLNPVLLAAIVYAVGTESPYRNSLLLLGGHTAAYFAAGIVIALGLERITSYLADPSPLDFAIQTGVGAALIAAGLGSRSGRASESKQPPESLTPVSSFVYGLIINFVGVPFALPYFAALDQLLKAGLAWQSSLGLLVAYNLLYALPFLLVPVTFAVLGKRSHERFQKVSEWVDRAGDWILPKVLVILGFVLIVDAVTYFVTGTTVL